jgi:ADP-ribose pyrophosphatase
MVDYLDIKRKHPFLFDQNAGPFKIILDPKKIDKWQVGRQEKSYPGEWTEIGIVFDDPYIMILRDLVEFPDGNQNGYIRIYNKAYLENGAAGVVMLPEKDEKILLMHQFRHATRSWHWEIPRGFGEPGVTAQDQAKAELEEEIGGKVGEVHELGLYFNNTGLEGNPVHIFFVRMVSVDGPHIELGTDQFRWVSVSELEEMIANAEITDGFTIAAYTRAKLKGLI